MSAENTISTDREIAGLKPANERYEVAIWGARGLAIRVNPTGERMFEYRYVAPNGKRRRLQLGVYPAVGLADARDKALKFQAMVIDGSDPSAERAAAKNAQRTGETISDLAEAYFKAAKIGLHGGRKRPKKEQTIIAEQGLFERYIKPTLGDSLFTQMKRKDIREFMRNFAADSGLSASSIARVGDVLSGIFGFAAYEDRIDANPVRGLAHPIIPTSRERRFEDDALAKLWKTLVLHSTPRNPGEAKEEDPISRLEPLTCLATRFILITLCRRGEGAGASWKEIDREGRKWTIPRERAKGGRTEVKPLSDEALTILDAAEAYSISTLGCRTEFVFPCLLDPLHAMDAGQVERVVRRLCQRLKIPHGSPHDFRRSGATTLTDERYGFPRFVVSKVLGHRINDGAPVTEIYDRNEYLPQKRAALNAWAGHILGLSKVGKPSAAVVESRMDTAA
jgi:integrase